MARQAVTPAEQAKLRDNSVSVIKQQVSQMRKCLEQKNKFMDALKHASTFLNELRTSYLTPKQYYELYIMVYDGLEYLSQYLRDTHPNSHLADLYELVQYAGNIVPRLYLMITVGTVYMGIKDAPVKEIMADMMEMSRGVQHPIRGLFLRYYLSQRTKDLLPTRFASEETKEEAALKGDLNDSVQFVLTNFVEMNKLWVRWGHQGHSSEHARRLEERKELQILVGSNLVRLSQMDGVDRVYYQKKILPAILEQIIKCRDVIAQEYLLDVVTQVFPDEFHLATLDELFDAAVNLEPEVSMKKVLMALVDRLVDFKKREPATVAEIVNSDNSFDIFDKLVSFVDKISEVRPDMPLTDYASILEGIAKLSITYYPENYDNVDKVFQRAGELMKQAGNSKQTTDGDAALQQSNHWKLLLLAPVQMYPDTKLLLNLDKNYEQFFELQDYPLRRSVAMEIIDKFLEQNVKVTTPDEVEKVFDLLQPLVEVKKSSITKQSLAPKDSASASASASADLFGTTSTLLPGQPTSLDADGGADDEEPKDSLELLQQQESLAKLLHLIFNRNPYRHFELLQIAQRRLQPSGVRVRYTYPTLVVMTLKIVRKLGLLRHIKTDAQIQKVQAMLTFCAKLIGDLAQHVYNAVDSFNMNLMAAEIGDEVNLVDVSYDFFTEALLVYEQSLADSRQQFQSLACLINKLTKARAMMSESPDNFNQLITKTTLYSSKLLRKTEQCRAVYMSSHLWWIVEDADDYDGDGSLTNEMAHLSLKQDGKRVLECLQKSLRIADSILDSNVSLELFIEILNQSLYFFIHGNEAISVRYLNGLVGLIRNNFKAVKVEGPLEVTHRHFERTLKYIREQKSIDPRFEGVETD